MENQYTPASIHSRLAGRAVMPPPKRYRMVGNVQAFKSSNTMSRKTYDEIVALFQKAGKRLPTLADDFNITGKIPSGTKVWNGTNHRQRGIEIDKLLGNNLGQIIKRTTNWTKLLL